MKLLEQYQAIHTQILKSFGFEQDWRVYPIDDMTTVYWMVNDSLDILQYFLEKDDIGKSGELYRDEIVKNHVLKGSGDLEGCTAIVYDTQTDGNIFFGVFDDAKKLDWVDEEEMSE